MTSTPRVARLAIAVLMAVFVVSSCGDAVTTQEPVAESAEVAEDRTQSSSVDDAAVDPVVDSEPDPVPDTALAPVETTTEAEVVSTAVAPDVATDDAPVVTTTTDDAVDGQDVSAPATCDDLRRDLGDGASAIDGRCERGWAYVDTGDLGDSQLVARVVDDRWTPVVVFPTPFLCADDLFAAGAPASVVDGVRWSCLTVPGPDIAYVQERSGGDLSLGDQGYRVRALQVQLARLGFGAVADADESFGPATQRRVARFQMSAGLVASGRADEATRRALGVFDGPRSVPADSVVIDGSGIDGARLGDREVSAEATLNTLLGPPDFDTGYDPAFFEGFPCFPTPFRSVRWGGVSAEFGNRGDGFELLHIAVNRDAEGFVTPEGISPGSTVEDLEAAGGTYQFDGDVTFTWYYGLPSGVDGWLVEDTLEVGSLNAGFFPCGE